MKLDVQALFTGTVKELHFEFSFSPELPLDKTAKGDISVKGIIRESDGRFLLTLSASVAYEALCARCLAPVNGIFSVELERILVQKGTLTPEQEEDNVDEYAIANGRWLNLEEIVNEEIVCDYPIRFLCSEDCPGLCPVCGKPLKDGGCNCADKAIRV